MAFLNPMRVTCAACGAEQHHSPKALLSYSAQCTECAKPLTQAGRWMHERILESALFVARIELCLEIEKQFGVAIQDDGDLILKAVNLRQYVDRCIAAAPELGPQREAVWSRAVSYMRSSVSADRAAEVEQWTFHDLFASDPGRER